MGGDVSEADGWVGGNMNGTPASCKLLKMHRERMRMTNPLELMNHKIKRRTSSAGVSKR